MKLCPKMKMKEAYYTEYDEQDEDKDEDDKNKDKDIKGGKEEQRQEDGRNRMNERKQWSNRINRSKELKGVKEID